jgi:hypothetical protein
MLNQTIVMIYENYLEEMSAAEAADAHHLGGLSRMFTGKQSDKQALLPVFDSKLAAELNRLFGQDSDSAEVCELAEWMQEQVTAYRSNPSVKYSFMAVQRHLIPLVGCLSSEDAAVLLKEYETAIPKRERFPIHTELLSKLKEQSKK